jgi:hypothetical protein
MAFPAPFCWRTEGKGRSAGPRDSEASLGEDERPALTLSSEEEGRQHPPVDQRVWEVRDAELSVLVCCEPTAHTFLVRARTNSVKVQIHTISGFFAENPGVIPPKATSHAQQRSARHPSPTLRPGI